jgi:hypothetical protein
MKSLVIACLLALVSFQHVQSAPRLPTPPTKYTYNYLSQKLLEIDSVVDQLPSNAFAQVTTIEDVQLWVKEVVPYFEYEDILDEAIYPTSVQFVYFDGGREHLHVLGKTYCSSLKVELNARYKNSITPLYGTPDVLGTIVHELAHVQGICGLSGRLDSEVTAQLMTLEILAAMVNKGTIQALGTFLNELRDMLYGATFSAARTEGRFEEFKDLRMQLAKDAIELARWEKSDRYWFWDQYTLEEILRLYNYTPVVELFTALELGSCSWNLFPDMPNVRIATFDWPCVVGVQTLQWPHNLAIDDIDYLLKNLTEIVSASL